MKKIKYLCFLFAILLVIVLGCRKITSDTPVFTSEDFSSIQKIDAHVHLANTEPGLVELAVKNNFSIFTINASAPDLGPIEEQQRVAVEQTKTYPKNVSFVATFHMEGWDNPDWEKNTIIYLKESISKGAIAVKVLNNIGMIFKDKNGEYVMIDDPKFDPIFDFLAEKGITLVGHLADSKTNWLPSADTTVKDYDAFFHPDYPGCPTFNAIIRSRDNMLYKHPNLKYISCHLGSQGHSLDELAKSLDAHPNMAIDVSARVKRFQVHSQTDWEKVKNFVIKYQDRIIYGTDLILDVNIPDANGKKISEVVLDRWINDWKYFTSGKVMTSPSVKGEFTGLALSKSVVEKIYRINAKKWYGIK